MPGAADAAPMVCETFVASSMPRDSHLFLRLQLGKISPHHPFRELSLSIPVRHLRRLCSALDGFLAQVSGAECVYSTLSPVDSGKLD